MNVLLGKNIVLGVTGGIAAYKAAELLRLLMTSGAVVRVVMTKTAERFVTPLTFQALSGHPVETDLWCDQDDNGMPHIDLARWADAVVVAPASAHFLSKVVCGSADDLLSTLCLATEAPIFLAPAMNRVMWHNVATQANCAQLRQRGVTLLGPAMGDQACGETGPGRMLEPGQLRGALADAFHQDALAGAQVLVTAGPTRESIDPVRFVSNHSSGKMGFAMARAISEAGAKVTLVTGPVALPTPHRVHRVDVECADEMANAVMADVASNDIFISTAAVADYRPLTIATQKIKKKTQALSLALKPTVDILRRVAALPQGPFTVGFAAETEALVEHGQRKLKDKQLDMIAVNQVGLKGQGFGSDENEVLLLWADGQRHFPLMRKEALARKITSVIAERFHAQNPA